MLYVWVWVSKSMHARLFDESKMTIGEYEWLFFPVIDWQPVLLPDDWDRNQCNLK